jgi:hypothetical protein
MKKLLGLLIVIGCVALVFTNPGEQAHKDVVYKKLSGEAGMSGFLGDIAGNVMENFDFVPFEYKNYLFFSTMTFRGDIVSVGIFNHVQTTDWDAKRKVGDLES